VTIYPVFIPWHRDQIARLGLERRAIGVRAVDTQGATYTRALEDENAYSDVKEAFYREAEAPVDAGAEVIIPAGGRPMLLFARDNLTVRKAVVLNGIAVAVAATEGALKLCRQTGVTVSRQGTFAKAPPEAIQEFLVGR
jgi:allantoin racemase